MLRPKVSAVIIVYNGERFLAEAIESVIAQSFTDWELIVADDGSTDSSREIAARYAGRDTRIRAISHSDRANHGMSATRNLGVASTRAPLIAFLDCDDAWVPWKLAEQVAILDAEPDIGLVYGRTVIWHSWETGNANDDFCYELGVVPDATFSPPVLLHVLLENRAQTPTTCNAIMRRHVLERVGGFENQFRGMFEDQALFAKVLLASSAYVSSRAWALYRQHGSSHSAQIAKKGHERRTYLRLLAWFGLYVLRTAPARIDVLAHIGRLFGINLWQVVRPRRPRWLRTN